MDYRPPARQSASLRRGGLLQLENHYCNNVLRSQYNGRDSNHRKETVRKLAHQAG